HIVSKVKKRVLMKLLNNSVVKHQTFSVFLSVTLETLVLTGKDTKNFTNQKGLIYLKSTDLKLKILLLLRKVNLLQALKQLQRLFELVILLAGNLRKMHAMNLVE